MTIDKESFASFPSVVNSDNVVDKEDNPEGDVFVALQVEKLNHNLGQSRCCVHMIDPFLYVLLCMCLHLPENSHARESISKTPIIQCLVKILGASHLCNEPLVQNRAVILMGRLVSGGHTSNIAKCYQSQAIPHLVRGLQQSGVNGKGTPFGEECAKVLKMLKIDDRPGTEHLMDASSIKTVVEAMTKTLVQKPDIREWGCAKLTYILNGYEGGGDIGKIFLDSGAMDAIVAAFTDSNNLTPNVVREASGCLRLLAEKSPAICKNLVAKGAVAQLGFAMQRWPSVDVQVPAKAALLAILTGTGN